MGQLLAKHGCIIVVFHLIWPKSVMLVVDTFFLPRSDAFLSLVTFWEISVAFGVLSPHQRHFSTLSRSGHAYFAAHDVFNAPA